jgi:N-acetylglucosamine-6-phosphate deacetylase
VPVRRRAALTARRLSGVSGETGRPSTISFDRTILRIEGSRNKLSDHVLPGFIDLQVNGGYGIDVMSASVDDLLRLSHYLAHEGTTGWLPAVITAPLKVIERCDAIVAEAIAIQQELSQARRRGGGEPTGAAILGMHLEGPFISPDHLGAHPALTLAPRGEALRRVLALKTLRLITLAPELDGAIGAIRQLIDRAVVVAIGHTGASYAQAAEALEAGATMFTHLFNAMPAFHHRSPGAAGAAAHASRPFVGVIPDGVHLHPATISLLGGLRTVFVTDRVSLAGLDQNSAPVFGKRVPAMKSIGGAAGRNDGKLVGSTITMLDGARLMIEQLGGDWAAVCSVTAIRPAAVLGLRDRGSLTTGKRADLILLDQQLHLKAVFIGGREID